MFYINDVFESERDPEAQTLTTAFTFTVTRTNPVGEASVEYTTSALTGAGAATPEQDFVPINGVLNFADGETSKTITVLVNRDLLYEPDESFEVILLNPIGDTIADNSGTGGIRNDDAAPTVSISPISIAQLEGNSGTTAYTFTVELSKPIAQPVVINYSTNDGTATLVNTDYQDNDGTLTFNPGEPLSQTITVLVNGDTQSESNETFTVSLNSATNAALAPNQRVATATIENDELSYSLALASANSSTVLESNSGTITFVINRNGATQQASTLDFTLGGSATLETDYTLVGVAGSGVAVSGNTIQFAAGATTATITLAVQDDTQFEAEEDILLTLSDPAGFATIAGSPGRITIVDNDLPTVSIIASDASAAEAGSDPGTFTITRTGNTSTALTVTYTIGGTATNGIDYTPTLARSVTIPAGQSSVNITIPPIDDTATELDESVILTLVNSPNYNVGATTATITIADNDTAGVAISPISNLVTTEAGGTATFTVQLTSQPTSDVTIPLSSSNLAEGSISTPVLTFNSSNWDQPQTVIVTGVDDTAVDGNIAYTIVTAPIISTDSNYNGLNPVDVAITNLDNDELAPPPLPTVSISATDANATETGNEPGVFTITRTGNTTEALIVTYTVGDTATNGIDYNAVIGTVTIPAGQSSTTVTITPIDDAIVEGSEVVSLTLTDTALYNLGASSATVTIADNDTAGIIIAPIADLVTTEAGGTATFTVQLNSQPTQAVTINLSSSNLAEGSISTPALIFDTRNWAQPQTVVVTGVDDAVVDGAIAYTIVTAPIISDDPNYAGLNPVDVAVTNLDDDVLIPPPLPTLSVSSISLVEDNSGTTAFTFTVNLSAASSSAITVEYATADGSATGLNDYTTIPLTPLNFAPGQTSQTITVNVQGDLEVEGDETFFVNLSNPTGATIAVAQGTGTILNDDVPIVVNAPPVAIDDQGNVTEGESVTIAVLENDFDPEGDPLTLDSFTNPQFGILIRNDDGTLTYQANLDFAGTDYFTYQIRDAQGGIAQATVVMTIDPLNLIGTDCCDYLSGTNTGNRIEGRSGNDWIEGQGGNDWLNGEAGWDTLIGGTGADRFVFASSSAFTPCSLGVDTIVDFDRRQGDAIVLSKTTFTALSSQLGNSLSADDFAIVNSACHGATLAAASVARIVFNQATGDLFYNQNGSCCGFGSGGRFATLSVNSSTAPLQASDFRVMA
ncbi:Calx-beta domain-containing protein [Pantanalinema sp. GBBB05]|uniref:beta strand repeat-containing protein n=1 Tax=Pantanalinema sp. GBBB05 TaxID=2604139 RepID=UPI001DDBD99C|nr:hypothetical protein [Pantanalinema sp. GBBB05]